MWYWWRVASEERRRVALSLRFECGGYKGIGGIVGSEAHASFREFSF